MVGGFNFAQGQDGIGSGDIFIDTDMDNDYYEYVLDLNFQSNNRGGKNKKTYTAYENTNGSIKFNKTEGGPAGGTQGQAWTYKSGGTAIKGFENLAMKYIKNKSDSKMGGGLTGGKHNAVIVDISFLGSDTGYNLWNSMKCGNDVMTGGEGGSAAVPEPATIFLLGSGLLGLFGYRKKFLKPKR
ncbi:MAG: PEP-CTERM sorting domain-containing protein [Deltaproteobacteria bacterium]|nr:PEP-CTERM sorting domain-containing protein [Deltaproteobacteria bacterium]